MKRMREMNMTREKGTEWKRRMRRSVKKRITRTRVRMTIVLLREEVHKA